MATNRKYAENMVGPWERDHLDKQRGVAQDIYGTNWESLKNQYGNLKSKLDSDRAIAQAAYQKGLSQAAESSFDRMNAGSANLVGRGLANSGLGERLIQSEVMNKGQNVNRLLDVLGNEMVSNAEGLKAGNEKMASGSMSLNNTLSGALGEIGNADLSNQMQYNQGVSNIAGSKSSRDIANSNAAAQRAANEKQFSRADELKEADSKMEEFYKRQAINEILINTELTDQQKQNYLKIMFDKNNADEIIEAFNTNSNLTELNKQAQVEFDKKIKSYEKEYGKIDQKTKDKIKTILQSSNKFGFENPFSSGMTTGQITGFDNGNIAKPGEKAITDKDINQILTALGRTDNGNIASKDLSVVGYPNMARQDELKGIMSALTKDNGLDPFGLPNQNMNRSNFDKVLRETSPIIEDISNYESMQALNKLKGSVSPKTYQALVDLYNSRSSASNNLNNFKATGSGVKDYADLAALIYGTN